MKFNNFQYKLILIFIIYLFYIKIWNKKIDKLYISFNNKDLTLISEEFKYKSIEDIISKIKNANKKNLLEIFNFIKKEININDFDTLRIKEELHTYLWKSLFEDTKNNVDFESYKKQLIKHSYLFSKNGYNMSDIKLQILSELHKNLYPWLYGFKYQELSDIINTSEGKGIIICTPNKYFHLVKSNIEIFRNVFNMSIPVEIFFNGERDLSPENQKILKQFKNVFISDISEYFNNTIIDIDHWAIKPFAILASRFEEAILLDSDSFYLRDPTILFTDPGYIETGLLLFKDKSNNPSLKTYNWLKSFIKNPLPETKDNRILNKKSNYEIESSTVVIHKTKTLLGLLNVCKLNEKEIRSKVVYTMVHGDKETFWIGFEMSRQHYYINKDFTVAIGELKIERNKNGKLIKKICGNDSNIGHSYNGELLYWNGHLYKDKLKNINKKGIYNAYFIVKDGINRWIPTINEKCFFLTDDQKHILFNLNQINIISKVNYTR